MSVKRLLEIASPGLLNPTEYRSESVKTSFLYAALIQMLSERNGFLALESSVCVYPLSGVQEDGKYTVKLWNASNLWKDTYSGAADNVFCFGADLFGNQYCITGDKIYLFDSETAELEYMADTLDAWADMIMEDDYWSGYSLAHEWQAGHGSIRSNHRLLPKIPFVLGGEFKLENLYSCESVQAMKSRGNMYVQMRDLPNGTQIQIKII